ncbi:hypothetical protein GCM10010404_68860 [Nonomuraea africana]|uniref:Uncharacterized protein n=1 Tax=Nonomuraea africana TaxID=46171 RepID=A0ABR9K7C7_9ACTN|nr:hypothetical protein [Nonomuraea africana]MBE1557711.1 hypothetical protein [Nonomuraea africana]
MIAPTVYRPLPRPQAWLITWIDGEPVVVINSTLGEDEQRAARLDAQRAARTTRPPTDPESS